MPKRNNSMIDYEVLFYRLLDYMVHEVGIDIETTLDEIGINNFHEQDEIISNFEDDKDYKELYKMETEDGRYLIGDDIDMDYIHGNIQAGYDVTVYKCEIIDGTDPEDEDVNWEWVEDYKA